MLLALLLERFAYYGFRAQFLAVLVARGVARSEAAAQYGTFTGMVMFLPIVFASLAVLAPRVWMAPVGGLVALGGYLLAISGAQESFPVSLLLIAVGTSMMKVTIVCAAADFVDSARARTVVGTLGYGVINVGAMIGPMVTSFSGAERFSKTPVVATVLLVLVCTGALVLTHVAPKKPATREPLPTGLLGVLLLIPVSTFLWLMVEMQPWNLELPPWFHKVNPTLIIPASAWWSGSRWAWCRRGRCRGASSACWRSPWCSRRSVGWA